jgi:hypothetical protein
MYSSSPFCESLSESCPLKLNCLKKLMSYVSSASLILRFFSTCSSAREVVLFFSRIASTDVSSLSPASRDPLFSKST